jgi:hypothetical protein
MTESQTDESTLDGSQTENRRLRVFIGEHREVIRLVLAAVDEDPMVALYLDYVLVTRMREILKEE